MEIRLKAKISAAERVLDTHGEWWKIIETDIPGYTNQIIRIQSLSPTMYYRPMAATFAQRTINVVKDELFTICEQRSDTIVEDTQENRWPILERLLNVV